MNPKLLGIIFIVIGIVSLVLMLTNIFQGITAWMPIAIGLGFGPVLLFVGIKQGY